MRAVLVAAAIAAWAAAPAGAAGQGVAGQGVATYTGRTLADVRVESGGRPLADAAVFELIETRIGEPLTMIDVRDTIEHLVGLGRFHDVRVFAGPGPSADSVALQWVLVPVQRIARIDVEGPSALSASAVREIVSDRLGGTLTATEQPAIVEVLRTQDADRGYRTPSIRPRLESGDTPDAARLVLDIDAGPRTTIDEVTVTGAPPGVSPAQIEQRLGISRGRPYDRQALDEKVADYEESLRGDGHYLATVKAETAFPADGATASMVVDVQMGPRVRLVFAGDPLPSGERDRLVPVRAERSIDLDLLEDAGRNIELYLRQQGYREARAPYTRVEGPELVVTFTVSRGPLHRVGTVRLNGNQALVAADLEPLLKLPPGEPYLDSRVAVVGAALVELYRVRGFTRAAVKPVVEVLPAESRGGVSFRPVDIRFDIVEGIRSVVGAVTFTGNAAAAETRLRPLVSLTPGRPYYRPLLAADRDALERLYLNDGYQSASVTFETTARDGDQMVDLTWVIREGPRTLVDHILVSGNVNTSASIIRRELTLAPGDPLAAEALIESQRRLSALGLFRRVRIAELPRSGSPNRDVLVEVEEAPSTSITEGGGIEVGRRLRASDTGPAEERIEVAPSGFFDITRRNLWGKNRSISFFTRVALRPRDPPADNPDPADTGGYGFNEYRVLGTYREPRLFGTAGDAQLTGFVEQGVRASFNFNRKGVRAEYARLLRPQLTATGRYTFDYTKRFDEQIAKEDQLPIDRLFPQVRLSTFFAGVLRDSRDDVLDPRTGTVLGVDGSLASRKLGSEVGFVKSFMQGFIYRRLPGRGYVVAAGARVGLARGFGPRNTLDPVVDAARDLPASERFFAGGDTTVRGFALDRLGTIETLDEDGFPQGGNGLVILNSELRAPYWKGIGLVGFVDTGNVFARAADISLGDLRVATGFGVRYRSPIGPLRVDLGFKVHPLLLESGGREKGYVVHISLGQAF